MKDKIKVNLAYLGIFLIVVMTISSLSLLMKQFNESFPISKDKLCIIYNDGIDCETNFTVEELNEDCSFLKETNPNGNPISSWECEDFRVEKLVGIKSQMEKNK